ncbi:hypothetical protein B0H19DRAFT_1276419 [Mycena capillaripes]|nr:hypothetical protein B0H19DRAFT_1276419 [Mycena capillaripes]
MREPDTTFMLHVRAVFALLECDKLTRSRRMTMTIYVCAPLEASTSRRRAHATATQHSPDTTDSAVDMRASLVLCDGDAHCIPPRTEPAAVYPNERAHDTRPRHRSRGRCEASYRGGRGMMPARPESVLVTPTSALSIEPDMNTLRRRGTACYATESGVYNATDGIVESGTRRIQILVPRERKWRGRGRAEPLQRRAQHPVVLSSASSDAHPTTELALSAGLTLPVLPPKPKYRKIRQPCSRCVEHGARRRGAFTHAEVGVREEHPVVSASTTCRAISFPA